MGRPENMDFPSCCTTMADSCVRNSEFVLCSTYVLYINRHKIPFHRISEYSCHAPLADNGTLFPLASRSGRFQCRAVTLIKHCRVRPNGVGHAPASETTPHGEPCDFRISPAQTRL